MRRNTAIVVGVAALALVVLLVVPLLAFLLGFGGISMPMAGWTGGTPMDGSPMHDGWFGGNAPVWFALAGLVSQLAFFVLVAGGVYLLYRAVARDRTDPALEELRRAYARGDVDDDEYERRRERLEDDR